MIFFVTGGSRGIGAAIVLEAARAGHDVAFTYVSREAEAAQVLAQAAALNPAGRFRSYALDVSDSAAVERVGDQALEDFGGMDAVVSNAGTTQNQLIASMTDEEWRRVIDVNLTGAFFVCRHFLPIFLEQRRGRFILISSVGHRGVTGAGNYAASKAGLIGLSGSIAKEYGRRGITSNAILPGVVETDMVAAESYAPYKGFWTRFSPLGRAGLPAEVAHLVLYLASPEAAYVTGQEISLTGGMDWTL